jgi:crotonobetainyl-CoA:carnitine CoA-transferase CaiB-like acyl-CoA transferase
MGEERLDPQALAGLRVLDLATFVAGPFCASLLGDFGASVVKVEDPGQGDSLRRLGERAGDESLWWLQEARNKTTVTCNLRDPRGQQLIRRLAAESDVVIENFRPGKMESWNLGYDVLGAENPGLVLVRISGYGQTGPNAEKPGFGRVAQAFGGLTYLAGFPDRPPAIPGSATLADYAAGLFGAFATLVALQHRERTGEGQVVDVSLFESVFRLLDSVGVAYSALRLVRERDGFNVPHAAPHSHYPTADGKWVAIACTNDKIYGRLCVAIGRADLIDDSRFGTVADRVRNREEIDAIVTGYTSGRSLAAVVAKLDANEVPVSPINSIADIFADPHVRARNTLLTLVHEQLGPLEIPNVVPRLSRTPGEVRHLGRPLGADNTAVYGALGLDAAELEQLARDGVI